MGQVNYKSDYAAFTASAQRVADDAHMSEAIESTGKCLRPRMRITRVMVGALFLSILCHAAFTISVAMAPTAPVAQPLERDIFAGTPRVVHLDWDQYYDARDEGSAADIEAEPPAEEPPAPVEVAAAAIAPKEDHPRDRKPEPTDEADAVDDAPEQLRPTPSLEALAQNDKASTHLPTDAPRTANEQENQPIGSQGSHNAGHGHGATERAHQGIARGPHRQAGSSGDGTGKDIGELRRGHIAQLNRAIRSKNPCNRKLTHHGLSGDVILGLTQGMDGRVDEVRVLRSSGDPMIDDAAKDFVREQRGLPAPDASLTGDVWKIGLRFKCDA